MDADINVTKADVEKVWITRVCDGEETDPIINPSFSMTAFILFCESVWMIPLWNEAVVTDADITDVKFPPYTLYCTSPAPTFSVLQKIHILFKEKLDSLHDKSVIKLVPAKFSLFFYLALGRYFKQIILYIIFQFKQTK